MGSASETTGTERATERRQVVVEETPDVPWLGLTLGYLAMVPLVVAAAVAVGVRDGSRAEQLAGAWGVLWAGALLTFLAGVRRGVSFRTEGGPRRAQLVTMLWIFALGVATLALGPPLGLLTALAGFLTLWLVDPRAARRAEVPAYFARLRPLQLVPPIGSLLVLFLARA